MNKIIFSSIYSKKSILKKKTERNKIIIQSQLNANLQEFVCEESSDINSST